MNLSEFDYFLPRELIAQEPSARREQSRLLVIDRRDESISHRVFSDLPGYINAGDLLVLNNTKVIPARLIGAKKNTLGKVDVLLSGKLASGAFRALVRPRLKIGQEVTFAKGRVSARIIEDGVLKFDRAVSAGILNKIGVMPLPPYIKRAPAAIDNKRYQTVYARNPGAIAAPTAGLHFTDRILKDIRNKKADIKCLSLHVGPGTFKPVKAEDIHSHEMDAEEFSIPYRTVSSAVKVRKRGGRIFAVGTTTTRALETIVDMVTGHRPPATGREGKTNLFIYPGYNFRMVDCLLTNFHLPKTTLFMLVCAFAGKDLIMRVYQEAVKEKYRFYSYGDAMLII